MIILVLLIYSMLNLFIEVMYISYAPWTSYLFHLDCLFPELVNDLGMTPPLFLAVTQGQVNIVSPGINIAEVCVVKKINGHEIFVTISGLHVQIKQ